MSGADRQCRVAPPDSAHTMDIGDTVALDFEPIAAWLKEISAQTHYAGLAATLLKAAMSFPAVDRGVAVFSEQGQLFEAANAGFPRDLAEVIVTEPPRAAFRIPETLMARALAQQRAVSTIDPATQSAFTGLDEISVRALCVPLAHKDRAIGVLYLEAAADAGAFSPACMAAISMIAAQAAVSFESARLFAALRETHKWMTRGQRLGRMGSYRFNTRTRESRGSREIYDILDLDPSLRPVPFEAYLACIHPEDVPNLEAKIFTSMEAGVPFRHEYRLVHKNGAIVHVAAFGDWDTNDAGDLELEGVISDITEQKQAQSALADAQARLARATGLANLGEIAGSIIHEINQPLTAIITGADASIRWLSRGQPDVVEAKMAMLRARDAGRRAVAVVQSLRSLAKRSKSGFDEVVIDDVIAEVLLLASSEIDRAGVVLRSSLASPDITVSGDKVQLQQVVLNLVRNATDAMQEVTGRPRLLTVKSAVDEGFVTIAFHDTGSGLLPEAREHLFEALYTTKSGGLGLGLSICRKIVSAHEGRIWASDNDPYGTSFQVALPLRRQ